MMKSVGLISLGGYLPAKEIPSSKIELLVDYLKYKTDIPREYIGQIQESGKLPGRIETNYDGWESKPWFQAWLDNLPEKKKADPFQGTKERRRVPMDPESIKKSLYPHPMMPSDAETIAGAYAIINSGIEPDEIDLVIVHSQIPDHTLPQNASLIQHKLGLRNAGAFSVDSCCSSFVTMIQVANALITSGMKKNVLIVSSYIDSHINDKTSYFSVDIGDGAIAGIVSRVVDGYGYINSHSTSHGERYDGIIYQRRKPALIKTFPLGPSYEQDFTTFYNQEACKDIARNATKDLSEVVTKTLEKADETIENIDFLVTHQPVSWAAHAWREAIGMPKEKHHETFEKYGNIATCAAATNLLEAIEIGKIREGDKVLITSSGAGENHIAVLEKISPELIKNVRP